MIEFKYFEIDSNHYIYIYNIIVNIDNNSHNVVLRFLTFKAK